jgi:chorismate mutase
MGVFRAIVVDGKIIGSISVERSLEDPNEGEVGYMLLKELWSKGIATEMVSQICGIAFRELLLDRIVAKVYESNVASIKVLEKNGFVCVQTLNNVTTKEGYTTIMQVYSTQSPVGAQDIKQVDSSPAFTHTIIAGPCSVESEAQILATAQALAKIPEVKMLRGGIWKPRTRPAAFEGRGEEGLVWLRKAKQTTGLPIITEVATPEHVELALKYDIDALWVGARTVVNPFSVQQLADAIRGVDIPVFIKNPVSPDLQLWIGAFERFQKAGVTRLVAIHRGFSYYKESPYRNFPMWEIPIELTQKLNVPIVTDVSHICGNRELLQATAQKALDLATDGLMIECHINPAEALTDAKQQITPDELKSLLAGLTFRSKSSCHVERDLANLRSEIDDIDNELLQLLARRMEVSAQIGEYKKRNNVTVVQMDRWKKILAEHVATGADLGLSPQLIDEVFEAIHQASIERQSSIMED